MVQCEGGVGFGEREKRMRTIILLAIERCEET